MVLPDLRPADLQAMQWVLSETVEAMTGRHNQRQSAKPPPVHTYPEGYQPGAHWASDEAWEIMDMLVPGTVNDVARDILAGVIAGRLMQQRDRAARIAEQGGARHVAEAIRRG